MSKPWPTRTSRHRPSCLGELACPREVLGTVILRLRRLAGNDDDPPAADLDERRVVGASRRWRARHAGRTARNACGVCTATSVARWGVDDDAVGVDRA